MRDNNENMIELLDISDSENIYSSVIRTKISGENLKLRFGIEFSDYERLKNILQFRPFENTGVARYRFFFTLSYRKDVNNDTLAFVNVRVEQLDRHKEYEFCVSKKYLSNILWFHSLTNKKEVEKMIEE